MKGYNLQHTSCTSSSLSHNLSHTIIEISFHNYTIKYKIVLQFLPLIGELPWENTTGHPIQRARKLLANKHPKNLFQVNCPQTPVEDPLGSEPPRGTMSPCTPMLGISYSKTGVQTWLNNNISESGRSSFTTNNTSIGFASLK